LALRFVVPGAAVIAAVTAAAAFASSPGSNGRIFYGSNTSGSYNIWSVNPDGSSPTQLTTQPSNATGAQRPSVSGDGSKVAYQQFDDNPPNFNRIQIWVMNGDGSGQTQLTTTGDNFLNTEPGISPDGSKIAFMRVDNTGGPGSATGNDIWIMNSNGTGQTQLTSSTDEEKSPEFSPDGTKIVYVRATGSNQIWLMNADGTNQHVLLNNPGVQDTGPSWSPDGQKIVYEDSVNGLSVMNADGSNPTPLHNGSGQAIMAGDPTWSPDGTKIAFYFVPGGGGSEGIFTVPATGGSNPQQLINLPTDFQSVYPSWAGGAPVVKRTLTVSIAGTGSGTVTSSPAGIACPGTTCSAQFADGTSVTLTATPGAGSEFVGWSGGGCSSTGTCQLTLSADTSVTAQFAHQPPPVAPNTKLGKPKISSKKRTATFTFKGVGTVTSFQCALARKHARLKFHPCVSPKRYRHLRPGAYTFEVRALNGTLADKTPAKKKFTIGH
jgi:Tol biopolymer transport system component